MHAAHAVVVVRRHVFELRKVAGQIAADRIGEIAPHRARRIGQPVGKARRARIQQQPRGFAGARRHHDRFGVDALLAPRRLVDVGNRLRLSACPRHDLAGHRIGNHREAARRHRRRNHHLAGAEVGGRLASAPALRAIMARVAPIQRLGQNRQPRRNARDVQLVAGLLDDRLSAARPRRRHETRRPARWERFLLTRRRRCTTSTLS